MNKLSIIAVLAAVSAAAHANYIVNGDFSNPNLGGGWSEFSSVPGWYAQYNATSGQVEPIEIGYMPIYGVTGWAGGNYGQNLEINSNAPSTVTQAVSGLISGDTYLLSFQYGMRAGDNGSSGQDSFDVLWDGNVIAAINPTVSVAQWEDLYVTAGSSNSLSFAGTGYSSLGGEVSNVSIAPGPGAVAPFLVGLIGLIRRRKNA